VVPIVAVKRTSDRHRQARSGYIEASKNLSGSRTSGAIARYILRWTKCKKVGLTLLPFTTALDSGQGLLSKRFCVAKNSADGGLGSCAREFAIRINRSSSARSVAA
jgi:hypothetical protein